jgi:hypothetical protein
MLYGMVGLAKLSLSEKDYNSARSLAVQALDLASALGDRSQRAEAVSIAAGVRAACGSTADELRLRAWLHRENAAMGLRQAEPRKNQERMETLLRSLSDAERQEILASVATLDPRAELKRAFA